MDRGGCPCVGIGDAYAHSNTPGDAARRGRRAASACRRDDPWERSSSGGRGCSGQRRLCGCAGRPHHRLPLGSLPGSPSRSSDGRGLCMRMPGFESRENGGTESLEPRAASRKGKLAAGNSVPSAECGVRNADTRFWPMMKPASSEIRKATKAATQCSQCGSYGIGLRR